MHLTALIIELAVAEPELSDTLDSEGHYLAAEVAFVVREEFSTTLTDVVFRRMMIGFDAEQGRSLYEAIASRVRAEFAWSAQEAEEEMQALLVYADSLRVLDSEGI